MKKLCFDNTEIDSPVRLYPVRLYQTGKDQFVVEYGSQVKEHLTCMLWRVWVGSSLVVDISSVEIVCVYCRLALV